MHPSRLVALLLALAVPACVPVATHGPRVEPGAVMGSVISLGTRPTLQTEVKTGQGNVSPVLPPMAAFARYGWPGTGSDSPIRLSAGVLVPLALPFSLTHPEVDVYAQLTPAEWSTAASAGAMVSRSYFSPYVQLGHDMSGVSVYTTQSYAMFRGAGPVAKVWMPAVAVQVGRFHVFAQGGIGSETLNDESTRDVRFLLGGVSVSAPAGTPIRPF